jgi:crescentin
METPAGVIDAGAPASEQSVQKREQRETSDGSAEPATPQGGEGTDALDATGRQTEMLRVGVGHLLERFDEFTRLKDVFSSLVAEPLTSLVANYPRIQAQLLEAAEALNRERHAAADLRGELRELKITYEKLADAFAVLEGQHQHATESARDYEVRAAGLNTALKEHEQRTGDLERQLAAETGRARTASDELQTLRHEAHQADATIARLERDLAEARETLEIVQFDNQTLRTNSTEQTQRLTAFEARQADMQQQLRLAQEQTSELQAKCDAEHNLRKKLEAQLDAERSSAQGEIAAREMKVEGIASRMAVTEKILTQTREQLRDRTEELKAAERVAREALLEKTALERRLQAGEQELQRQTTVAAQSSEARTELDERCEMLTKAIAAKDSLLQRADNRASMLLERIDQLTRSFDEERSTLETNNKKLWDELQREKSERALAQGALETARRRRIETERELARVQLERRAGQESEDSIQAPAANAPADSQEGASNVMPFKSADG